ncbi:MAG: hypothetical protein FWD26_03540 [Treponema sp.]|nr:hypothetical protein [Treponema sp.]
MNYMKTYKHGGHSEYAPREIHLNRNDIGVLSKTKSGHIHMDFYEKGKGPNGSSMEFAGDLLGAVISLFK